MITLDVEEYCQNCSGFEPDTERMRIEDYTKSVQSWSTVIVCTNKRKCKRLYEHVKREYARMQKTGEDSNVDG